MTIWAAPAGASPNRSQLEAKALSLSNFPTGWAIDNSAFSNPATGGGCLAAIKKKVPSHDTKVRVAFANGQLPALQEYLVAGKGAQAAYAQINHALAKCGHFTVASGGQTINGTVGAMSFPQEGAQSNAYAVNITVQGVNAGADLVLFRVGSMLGEVIYEDLGTPDIGSVQAYVNEAVNKVEGKPTTTPTTF
jgi:hypothetical protein